MQSCRSIIATKKIWSVFYLILLISSVISCHAHAVPLLRCLVSYADSTKIVESSPTQIPYSVESVDIGERFSFKAIMFGDDNSIEYIKLYAYFQTRHKDILIHQATYLPPFTPSITPLKLTPLNHLYAGGVERELQYQCTLQGVQQ